MATMFSLQAATSFMSREKIDAWVLYDFRGSNPVFWHVLGQKRSTTRRAVLVITRGKAPELLIHAVDRDAFRHLSYRFTIYRSWQELHEKLKALLDGSKILAVEYSIEGSIPTVSWVDAGTIELLRKWGFEIVSSANLFQIAAAAWDKQAIDSHNRACPLVANIKDAAFNFVKENLHRRKTITEYDVQQFIIGEFSRLGLETEDAPIVAANENSGDPHYEPSASASSVIKQDDWILIDLWARFPGEENVFSDITWVGYAGSGVPPKYIRIFDIVRSARDAVILKLREAWSRQEALQGWQLDQIARDYISAAGYSEQFVHRTGHSIGPGQNLHALGVNLDNLETKDTRLILPGVGFSIEPGIYLPEFGVRLEVNAFIDPVGGPSIATPIQTEIITLGG